MTGVGKSSRLESSHLQDEEYEKEVYKKEEFQNFLFNTILLMLCSLRYLENDPPEKEHDKSTGNPQLKLLHFDMRTKECDTFGDVVITQKDNETKKRFLLTQLRSEVCKGKVGDHISMSEKGRKYLCEYFRSFLEFQKSGDEKIEDILILSSLKTFNDAGHLDCALKMTIEKNFVEKENWKKILKEKFSACDEKNVDLFLNYVSITTEPMDADILKQKIKQEIQEKYEITQAELVFRYFQQEIIYILSKEQHKCVKLKEVDKFFEDMKKRFGRINFGIPDSNKKFTGRKEELNRLLEVQKKGIHEIVITGLGGIGKSQLAKKFVERNQDSFDSFIWMNAESREKLSGDFYVLAKEKLFVRTTNSDGEKKSIETIVEEVYHYFSSRKCMFIFDNYENANINSKNNGYIKEFLPNLSPKPFTLITSRCESWREFYVLPLSTFSEEDSVEFLEKSLEYRKDLRKDFYSKLARDLYYFPFALQQAVEYKKRECPKRKRNKNYELDKILFPGPIKDPMGQETYKTWNDLLEISKISSENKTATLILKITSYFKSEKIVIDDIEKCLENVDTKTLKSSLMFLNNLSMISIVKGCVSINGLVQKVMRYQLKQNKEENDILKMLENVSSKLENENAVHLKKYTRGYKGKVFSQLRCKSFELPNKGTEQRPVREAVIMRSKSVLGEHEVKFSTAKRSKNSTSLPQVSKLYIAST